MLKVTTSMGRQTHWEALDCTTGTKRWSCRADLPSPPLSSARAVSFTRDSNRSRSRTTVRWVAGAEGGGEQWSKGWDDEEEEGEEEEEKRCR